ncbi:IgaA/UmoB family intracellular growth attenuator [Acinetobacter baumannii]
MTRAITRYGITTDDPNKWRYFLDSVEVHLPRSGNNTSTMKIALS